MLSRSRPAFERLMADELICRNLTGAFYAALFMAAPEASGLALEWWEVAHRHRPGLLLDRWYVWMRRATRAVHESQTRLPECASHASRGQAALC